MLFAVTASSRFFRTLTRASSGSTRTAAAHVRGASAASASHTPQSAFGPPSSIPSPRRTIPLSERGGERRRVPAGILKRLKNVVHVEAGPSATMRPWIPPETSPGQRSLTISIVGAPNAGKSTLLNRILGRKVSAVSPKYNTTRDRVLGVTTRGTSQLVFTDTPGFVPASGVGTSRYVKTLVTAARDSVPQSDVVLFVVDAARRFDEEARAPWRRWRCCAPSTTCTCS